MLQDPVDLPVSPQGQSRSEQLFTQVIRPDPDNVRKLLFGIGGLSGSGYTHQYI